MAKLRAAVAAIPFRIMERASRWRAGSRPKGGGGVYSFEARLIDGRPLPLETYRGNVLLLVNTASECGFTAQYRGLQALHERYAAAGLRVVAFPCNDFGAQEPGDERQIAGFCRERYGVAFDLCAKVSVREPAMHPLFSYLTRETAFAGALVWNFTKFLVDRTGVVAGRFGPAEEPLSQPFVDHVQRLLEAPAGSAGAD